MSSPAEPASDAPTPASPADRLRAGLRRHGVIRRPPALRSLLRATDARFTDGNAVTLYRDGRSGLAAMLEAIEAAERRIHFETYILHADATGHRFLEALERKSRAGVEVRVLYDALGSRGITGAAFQPLLAAGGDVVAFNPLRRLYPRWAPRRRDHRKILVVDGTLGFTGGLNVGDEYVHGLPHTPGPSPGWRDAHVRLRGPAVRALEAVFLESWFRADGPDAPWLDPREPLPATTGGSRLAVLADGPTYRRRRTRDLLVRALDWAQRSARLVSPYFVPDRRVMAALGRAAERGVRVVLLTTGRTDHPSVRWAARGRVPRLLEEGVRVYEYEAAIMHAKVAVFDERWAVLGTSNLDHQSFRHSYEVNLLVDGGPLPEELARLVDEDVAASPELTPAVLDARSCFARLRDRVAAALLARL